MVDPGLHAAGSWALRFDAFPHVKIGGVVRGDCWLALDGQEPVHLREGDFYLLGNPPSYLLASSLTAEPQAAQLLWDTAANGVARIGAADDEDTYLCGGSFRFDESNAPILIDILPRLVHVKAGNPRVTLLTHVTELLNAEVEGTAAGRSLVLDHLVQILFVHVLRAHAEQTGRPAGSEPSTTTASALPYGRCTPTSHTAGACRNSPRSAACPARRSPNPSRTRSAPHPWNT
ncbi:cupin domain-containing protein [Actinoplanes couchii]|uniref:cupin domain-containing protein n=1 Tax=Actinoplanes couchii TaxID=403638 RepID=UPI001944BF14|nr:cupin domain-containing protein [Actinoplanes couchii]MDR6318497.1 hypothetical protein [Actinoplanes couchii]